MAGGSITRIVGGKNSIETEEWIVYTEKFTAYAGKGSYFTADKGTNIGNPKDSPPAGKYFVKGWWTDRDDKEIKEALIGDTVRFHIQMDKKHVPPRSKINFTLMDWDGLLNPDDPISLYSTEKDPQTGKYMEIKELLTDANGKTSLSINLTEGLVQFTNDDGGNEIELYFDCSYYDISDKETEKLDLPLEESNYLIVYEKEVLITVFVELPHSKETGWGAKGLAGHSAIAIGDRYFDYGPNKAPGIYSEREYDIDFNKDGDKDDNVEIANPDFMNAPGQPWWGTHIAHRKKIKPEEVTLEMVLEHIQLDWSKDATYIYGKVHKIEFYVKESEANKMIKWWKERYKHLKVYSVFPWTGEQCTTTVKTAIQEAFPFKLGKMINHISDETQTPSGLLFELKKFISSSKQHYGQPVKVTVIKEEAADFHE